ncbi:hypothetical protein EV702DRAFT_1192488 [Suillus placidus]|uniref:Uncharacterized protein n=1 Tax=Suillus placidus TaxID=48579 RepID=A0A9P7D7E1_9AGAM|nr:hypothetical protein EV702DRAFT_1192488 [Suillus placidus]
MFEDGTHDTALAQATVILQYYFLASSFFLLVSLPGSPTRLLPSSCSRPSLVDMVGIVDATPQYCSRTRFEREPDLPNAFRGVRSRVRPTAEPEPSIRFGVRKFLPENRTEPDFGSTRQSATRRKK